MHSITIEWKLLFAIFAYVSDVHSSSYRHNVAINFALLIVIHASIHYIQYCLKDIPHIYISTMLIKSIPHETILTEWPNDYVETDQLIQFKCFYEIDVHSQFLVCD